MNTNLADEPVKDLTKAQTYTVSELSAGPPCCEPSALIKVQQLSVRYGTKTVISDISVDLFQGCITALIGPSGCGKTTFLSTLNRLLDLAPNASVDGKVLLDNHNIYEKNTDLLALRRRIGMIFQRPNPFALSIKRNLELPLLEYGYKRSEREQKIQQALQDVGLWDEVKDRLNRSALSLSGGQQQRLCIARALVLEPEVLLMDEPCSALDPISSAVVEECIAKLRGRFTVVIVTHNLAQARRLANYAAFFWMQNQTGKLIEFDRCQTLFDQPRHDLTSAYVSGQKG